MPKLTLPTVQSGYYTSTALNAIFDQIELEFDKVFYRNNPVSTPNSLSNDMDLNGNDVLNGGSAFFDKLILQGMDFTDIVMNATTTISNYLIQAESARDAAQASEIAAASSASSSSSSASAAASSASAASTSASNASTSASQAAASAAQALASANSAASSESAAAGSAAAALASQTAAATSATNAAGSASSAATQASNAAGSALSAATSAQNAEDTFIEYKSTWYGPLASAPSLDPFGNPITVGDVYFDTTDGILKVYDGTVWTVATIEPGTLGTAAVKDYATANTPETVVYRDASGNFSAGTITANLSGNATTATSAASADKLTTARTIGGVSFDGTSNINLPGVNTTGNQSTTGNASTATILQTARTINSVSFNGSQNITVEPYVERDDSTNASRYITFVDDTTAAYKRLNMDSGLSYNPSTNTVSADLSGNAATAATLQTARTINGTSFNGSANITTANWGTSRTITIAGVGKSVNGSANVTWSLAELGIDALKNPSGWQKLPSGIIIQWGTRTVAFNDSLSAVTFPIAFPTSNLWATVGNRTSLGGLNKPIHIVGTPTTTGMNLRGDGGTSVGGTAYGDWIAIGF